MIANERRESRKSRVRKAEGEKDVENSVLNTPPSPLIYKFNSSIATYLFRTHRVRVYKAPKLRRRYDVVDCVVVVELSTASSYCIRHLLHCVFFHCFTRKCS